MKKLLLSIALLISCASLNAGIVGRALDDAAGVTEAALAVPGDVLYGPDYYDYYDDGYAPRYGYRYGYHRPWFGHRHWRD